MIDMKELFIEVHDELTQEYMDNHPEATEYQAQDATAAEAWDMTRDRMADMADRAHDEWKDRAHG